MKQPTTHAPAASAALLSPREAADRLLEAATLQAYRTNGMEGLPPIRTEAGDQVRFRAADVSGVIGRICGTQP